MAFFRVIKNKLNLQSTDIDISIEMVFQGLVELNLSCPNIPGKPQTGYDFDRTNEVLKQVFSFYTKPLGVKLPPYFDIVHFEIMAEIIIDFFESFIKSGRYCLIQLRDNLIKRFYRVFQII